MLPFCLGNATTPASLSLVVYDSFSCKSSNCLWSPARSAMILLSRHGKRISRYRLLSLAHWSGAWKHCAPQIPERGTIYLMPIRAPSSAEPGTCPPVVIPCQYLDAFVAILVRLLSS